MTVTVRPGDPRSPEDRALLWASHASLASLHPAEHSHHLSVDELAEPHVSFLIAEHDGKAVGCAALARMNGHGFAKRGPFGNHAPGPHSVFMERRL